MRSCSGITLVELVVTLALGAMLMTAIVGVLAGTQRELDAAAVQSTIDCRCNALKIIHKDLMAASEISSKDGYLWLSGVFSDRGASRPRLVGYKCVPGFRDGDSVMMRLTGQSAEPVAIGPSRLLMERLDSSNVPQPISTKPTAMPSRIRLWIWMPNEPEGRPGFVRDLVVH